jgi:hypothetical protein
MRRVQQEGFGEPGMAKGGLKELYEAERHRHPALLRAATVRVNQWRRPAVLAVWKS